MTQFGKYKKDEPAGQFTNREGILVRSIDGELVPVGKAYAFFDCNAPKEEVERELSQIPHSLELYLSQGEAPLFQKYQRSSPLGEALQKARVDITYNSSDPKTKDVKIAECNAAKNREFNYVIEAYSTDKDNADVGRELGHVTNSLYTSPLYKKRESIRSSITAEIDGEYLFVQE